MQHGMNEIFCIKYSPAFDGFDAGTDLTSAVVLHVVVHFLVVSQYGGIGVSVGYSAKTEGRHVVHRTRQLSPGSHKSKSVVTF